MASKKRWYVLRPFKLNSGHVAAGKFLTTAEMKEIPDHLYKVLVRGVRLYDLKGEVDTPWGERNKHKLRIRCLAEIGTKEAAEISDMVTERLSRNRMVKFGGVREKAIAKEIKAEVKAAPPKAKPKPKAEEIVKEDVPTPSAVDDLLGGPDEPAKEAPKAKTKTRRRHRAK